MAAPQRLAGVVAEDQVVVGQGVTYGQQPLGLVRAMGAGVRGSGRSDR
jgi:hypothetical protein